MQMIKTVCKNRIYMRFSNNCNKINYSTNINKSNNNSNSKIK